jgi:UPF0716 family protein affecting phage T7 exclusion
MQFDFKQAVRVVTACALATLFAVPQGLMAQAVAPAHVVSPADLQKAAVSASQTREQNIQAVQTFLSSEKAVKALKTAHMDPQQVTNAVSNLNDAELARLAERAQKAQANFAAGDLSDRDLIWIIVGIAALILIIVAVR